MKKFNWFGYAKNIGHTMFLGTSATGTPIVGTRKLLSARRRKTNAFYLATTDGVAKRGVMWELAISSQLMSGTDNAPMPLIVLYRERKDELVVNVDADGKACLLLEEKPIGIDGKTYEQPRLIQPPF